MTPEQLAELRNLHAVATDRSLSAYKRMQAQAKVSDLLTWNGFDGGDGDLPELLDMAERCADYDKRIGEVMPKDFKDWHDNLPREWPEVAAWSITNLREREAWAFDQMVRALDQVKRLRERLDDALQDAEAARDQ